MLVIILAFSLITPDLYATAEDGVTPIYESLSPEDLENSASASPTLGGRLAHALRMLRGSVGQLRTFTPARRRESYDPERRYVTWHSIPPEIDLAPEPLARALRNLHERGAILYQNLRGTPAFDAITEPQGDLATWFDLYFVAKYDVQSLRFEVINLLSVIFGRAMNRETFSLTGYLFFGARVDYLPSPVEMNGAARRAAALLHAVADQALAAQLEASRVVETLTERWPAISSKDLDRAKTDVARAKHRVDWIQFLLDDGVATAARMSSESALRRPGSRRARLAGLGRGLRRSLELARRAHLGEDVIWADAGAYSDVEPILFNRTHLDASLGKDDAPLISDLIRRDATELFGPEDGPARALDLHREALLVQHVLVAGAVIAGAGRTSASPILALEHRARRWIGGSSAQKDVAGLRSAAKTSIESAEDELWQVFFEALGDDAVADLRLTDECAIKLGTSARPMLPAP